MSDFWQVRAISDHCTISLYNWRKMITRILLLISFAVIFWLVWTELFISHSLHLYLSSNIILSHTFDRYIIFVYNIWNLYIQVANSELHGYTLGPYRRRMKNITIRQRTEKKLQTKPTLSVFSCNSRRECGNIILLSMTFIY